MEIVMNSPHYGCCGKPVSEGTCTCGGNVTSPPRVLNSRHKPEPLGLPGPWEFGKDNSQQQVANQQQYQRDGTPVWKFGTPTPPKPVPNYGGKGLVAPNKGNKPEPLGLPVWKF